MLRLLIHICTFILFITAIISFYNGIKYRKKHEQLKYLYLYPLSSFLQIAIFYSTAYFSIPKHLLIFFVKLSIHCFIIIETASIFFFFWKINILTKKIKVKLLILYILSILTYIYYLTTSTFFFFHATYAFYFQSILVLIPCFIYVYQLFLSPPILNLLEEPSFWFTSGLLVYYTLTLPQYFMLHYFYKNPMSQLTDLVSVNGYITIFLFLIKGYKCNPKITIWFFLE